MEKGVYLKYVFWEPQEKAQVAQVAKDILPQNCSSISPSQKMVLYVYTGPLPASASDIRVILVPQL